MSPPWTNSQVERLNRTLKEATVNRYSYDAHEQLKHHLSAFVNAYNFAKKLKVLKGLTPYQFIVKGGQSEPATFIIHPTHQSQGLNI